MHYTKPKQYELNVIIQNVILHKFIVNQSYLIGGFLL